MILFIFNYINEKPFIKIYKWPNFGDNYFAGLILISLFLVKKSLIKFNRSDFLFFAIIIYIALIEVFYFKIEGLNKFSLLRDLLAIFYVFKVLSFIEIENKIKKLILYTSIIFIFLTVSYFAIYLPLHFYEFKFDFINYGDPSLKNYLFFQLFFLFIVCSFNKYNKFAFIFYLMCSLVLIYFPSRGQLLAFMIVTLPILFNKKLKIFLIIAHLTFSYFAFFAEYKESAKNSFVPKTVYLKSVEAIKNNDRSIIEHGIEGEPLDKRGRHGEVNSTITRLFHIEMNLKRLKKNIILGSGYNSVTDKSLLLIAKTCECLILHPLFSYGLVGQVFLLIFIIFLFKDYSHYFKNIDEKFFLISLILLFVIYSLSAPLFPAWFGLGFFLLINQNKNEKYDTKIANI